MSASSSGARHDPSAQLAIAPPWQVREDLHLHTNASDGVLSPTELVDLVSSTSLTLFAITDHDTTSGLDEAETASIQHPDITFIPGSELSVEVGGNEIHLTCHFIDRQILKCNPNCRLWCKTESRKQNRLLLDLEN